MNSFTVFAVGTLAKNPELIARGDTTYTRFCLVGTDDAGTDGAGTVRQIVTSLWFVAFSALAERIARVARKGDQLMVEARIRANTWTDRHGERQYDHSFIVRSVTLGVTAARVHAQDDNTGESHERQRDDDNIQL